MILDQYIEIQVSNRTAKYYEQKGYVIPKKINTRGILSYDTNGTIKIRVNDLKPSTNIKVKCKCEKCGKIRDVLYSNLTHNKNSMFLKTGETLCRECRNKTNAKERSPFYKHGNVKYSQYKTDIKRRKIPFNLTVSQFEELSNSPCYYCGAIASHEHKYYGTNEIICKDRNIGYIYNNCIPCCQKCKENIKKQYRKGKQS